MKKILVFVFCFILLPVVTKAELWIDTNYEGKVGYLDLNTSYLTYTTNGVYYYDYYVYYNNDLIDKKLNIPTNGSKDPTAYAVLQYAAAYQKVENLRDDIRDGTSDMTTSERIAEVNKFLSFFIDDLSTNGLTPTRIGKFDVLIVPKATIGQNRRPRSENTSKYTMPHTIRTTQVGTSYILKVICPGCTGTLNEQTYSHTSLRVFGTFGPAKLEQFQANITGYSNNCKYAAPGAKISNSYNIIKPFCELGDYRTLISKATTSSGSVVCGNPYEVQDFGSIVNDKDKFDPLDTGSLIGGIENNCATYRYHINAKDILDGWSCYLEPDDIFSSTLETNSNIGNEEYLRAKDEDAIEEEHFKPCFTCEENYIENLKSLTGLTFGTNFIDDYEDWRIRNCEEFKCKINVGNSLNINNIFIPLIKPSDYTEKLKMMLNLGAGNSYFESAVDSIEENCMTCPVLIPSITSFETNLNSNHMNIFYVANGWKFSPINRLAESYIDAITPSEEESIKETNLTKKEEIPGIWDNAKNKDGLKCWTCDMTAAKSIREVYSVYSTNFTGTIKTKAENYLNRFNEWTENNCTTCDELIERQGSLTPTETEYFVKNCQCEYMNSEIEKAGSITEAISAGMITLNYFDRCATPIQSCEINDWDDPLANETRVPDTIKPLISEYFLDTYYGGRIENYRDSRYLNNNYFLNNKCFECPPDDKTIEEYGKENLINYTKYSSVSTDIKKAYDDYITIICPSGGCDYKVEVDCPTCNVQSSGTFKDIDDLACIEASIGASNPWNDHYIRDNKTTTNQYCKMFCTEEIEYNFPNNIVVNAGRTFSIGGSGAFSPVLFTSTMMCQTLRNEESNEPNKIDVSQFVKDMNKLDIDIKNSWKDYQEEIARESQIDSTTNTGVTCEGSCKEWYPTYPCGTEEEPRTCGGGCKEYHEGDVQQPGDATANRNGIFVAPQVSSWCDATGGDPEPTADVEGKKAIYEGHLLDRTQKIFDLKDCTDPYYTFDHFHPDISVKYTYLTGSNEEEYILDSEEVTELKYKVPVEETSREIVECGNTGEACITKTLPYNENTFYEYITEKTLDYSLPSGLYTYISKKTGISYHSTNPIINAGDPFVTMESNLPVPYMKPSGSYPIKLMINSLGENNKYEPFVFFGTGALSNSCEREYECTYIVDNKITPPDKGLKLVYRQVDLVHPFPNREPETNWKGKEEIITNTEYLTKEPLYEINLGTKEIFYIRDYNKTRISEGGYGDFNLECDLDGFNCTSRFLDEFEEKFGSEVFKRSSR